MKKYISILIAVLMLAGCMTVLPALAEGFRIGDANGDGKVNIKDATHIQRYVASIIIFSDEELRFADVNADGKVNIKDATMIQKFIANLIEGFPSDNEQEDATTASTDAVTESVGNSTVSTAPDEPTTVTSAATESTDPEETKPADPEVTKPTEPAEPEETKPTEPEETKPAEPEETKPTEPEVTKPTEPVVTKPSVDEDGFNNQIVRP